MIVDLLALCDDVEVDDAICFAPAKSRSKIQRCHPQGILVSRDEGRKEGICDLADVIVMLPHFNENEAAVWGLRILPSSGQAFPLLPSHEQAILHETMFLLAPGFLGEALLAGVEAAKDECE